MSIRRDKRERIPRRPPLDGALASRAGLTPLPARAPSAVALLEDTKGYVVWPSSKSMAALLSRTRLNRRAASSTKKRSSSPQRSGAAGSPVGSCGSTGAVADHRRRARVEDARGQRSQRALCRRARRRAPRRRRRCSASCSPAAFPLLSSLYCSPTTIPSLLRPRRLGSLMVGKAFQRGRCRATSLASRAVLSSRSSSWRASRLILGSNVP